MHVGMMDRDFTVLHRFVKTAYVSHCVDILPSHQMDKNQLALAVGSSLYHTT